MQKNYSIYKWSDVFLPPVKRRLVRVVEGARLESVYTSKGYRGFESLSLRWNQYQKKSKARKSWFAGFFDFTTYQNCPLLLQNQ